MLEATTADISWHVRMPQALIPNLRLSRVIGDARDVHVSAPAMKLWGQNECGSLTPVLSVVRPEASGESNRRAQSTGVGAKRKYVLVG